MIPADLLPAHGFVLAGGRSLRMGRDKALLPCGESPMVDIALGKLRTFCADVAIVGNRVDLKEFAPVVPEMRLEIGPVAGIEAGLFASAHPWSLFLPVDVPLMPEGLLRSWALAVLQREAGGTRLSFLRAQGMRQPTFCLLHRDCKEALRRAVENGSRKLGETFEQVASTLGPQGLWIADAESLVTVEAGEPLGVAAYFTNVNTPQDLAMVEGLAQNPPART